MTIYNAYKIREEAWMIPYIGRKVTSDFSDVFDEENGYYPSDYDTAYTKKGIILNLCPVIKDNRVFDITYYKEREDGYGFGKPQSTSIKLSQKEIELFTSLLNQYTKERISPVLKELEQNAYVALEQYDKAFTEMIHNAIEISFTYPEVLFDVEFWESNQNILPLEYAEEVTSILHCLDWEKYVESEDVKNGVIDRKERKQIEIADDLIYNAIIEQNDEVFFSQIRYINKSDKKHKESIKNAEALGRYDYITELGAHGVPFTVADNQIHFSHDEVIKLTNSDDVLWKTEGIARLYDEDKHLVLYLIEKCANFDKYTREFKPDIQYGHILRWAMKERKKDILLYLSKQEIKPFICITRSVDEIEEETKLIEEYLEESEELKACLRRIFDNNRWSWDKTIQPLFESFLKQKKYDKVKQLVDDYNYSIDISYFSKIMPKYGCKRWTKINDEKLRCLITNYYPAKYNVSYADAIIQPLIARVIEYCPDDTVKFLFQNFKGFHLYNKTSDQIKGFCEQTGRTELLVFAEELNLV